MVRRVVALVALVVLSAGCSSFAGGDANTPTLTPADVPTREATPDERVDVAPGLSTGTVSHPDLLADYHVEAAKGASYEMVLRYHENRTLGSNTTELNSSQRAVVENASVYRRDVSHRMEELTDGNRRLLHGYAEYADGESLYRSWRSADGVGREFRRSARPDQRRARYAAIPKDDIRQYLTLESATVARVAVPPKDRRYYRVVGTRSSLPGLGAVENYTARAVVREDGFVRSLTVTYDAKDDGRDVEVTYTLTYTDVGTATVSPPSWLPDARSAVATESERGD